MPNVEVTNEEDRIANRHKAFIREAFKDSVSDVEEGIDEDQLEEAIASGSAITITREFDWDLFEENFSNTESQIGKAHNQGMDMMVPKLEDLGFEEAVATAGSVRAENWIRQQNAEMVNTTLSETQKAVKQAVNRGIQQGRAVSQTTTDVRNAIGLTQRQEGAVANFRRMLVEQDSNAVGRFLSGTEKQRVRSIVANGGTTEEINELTRRYRNHQLNLRADKIARHETRKAIERGKLNQIRDLHDRGIVDKTTIRKVWRTVGDDRVCPFCQDLAGETLSVEERYNGQHRLQNGSLRQMRQVVPPAHPSCRCIIEYITV